MSEAIILPSLSQWTKNHLTTIIQATTPSALDASLNAFLFKDAVITVNGCTISRYEFTTQLRSEKFAETKAFISFAGAIEVPADPTSHELVGAFPLYGQRYLK